MFKPILFNTEMVKAILDGRKTVTRRLVRKNDINELLNSPYHKEHPEVSDTQIIKKLCMPPYQLGDILYVRETWQCWRAHRYEATADIRFKAGGEGIRLEFANGSTDSINRDDYDTFVTKWFSHNGEKWLPSIHMPKEAARIFLKVTDVRAERLKDITDSEAEKEGAQPQNPFDYAPDKWPNLEHFKKIWNSTLKKSNLDLYGWDANPWVWVIEFERCRKPDNWLKEGYAKP